VKTGLLVANCVEYLEVNGNEVSVEKKAQPLAFANAPNH
jgi:hypothetical protein